MVTNTYEFLTGELVEIEAESEAEAWELLEAGAYEQIETLSELRSKPCSCSNPTAKGWHVDDEAGITFGGLKKAQNEAAQQMLDYVLNIYFKKGDEGLENLARSVESGANGGEWLFRESCEWEN